MSNTNQQSEWQKRERGALWKKQGQSQDYLTGVIKSLDDMGQEVKSKIIVFANKNKQDGDNKPDFIIYESKELNQGGSDTATQQTSSSSTQVDEEIPALLK